VRALGVLLAAGLLVVPLASAATFGRPAEIPLAKTPVAVATFDATQDGIDDVVLADATPPGVTVLPAKQDGSFERPLEIGAGPVPRAVAVGDFDNDGGDDLAVAGGNEIVIFTDADATLVQRTSLTAPSVSTVVAADLDVDGNQDLLAGSSGEGHVLVFNGLGDGTFLPGREYVARTNVASLYVADFDGDEVPDVAVAGNGLTVLIGNGDGTLATPPSVLLFCATFPLTPCGASTLTGGDFDSDGDTDVAVALRPNSVAVLFNEGDGQVTLGSTLRVGGMPVALGAADIDDDGTLDLVTANRGTNDVSILLGREDGGFGSQTRVRVGKRPVAMAIDDLNSDGTSDLVTANRLSRSATVLLNGVDAPQPVICLVPRVAGRKLAVAQRLITAANCRMTHLRRKYSKRVRRGRVIAVTPLGGMRLPVGSAVALLVSRGPKPTR
jgi:hypothetical protein